MLRFKVVLILVITAIVALLLFGSLPERRFADGMGCTYRTIYKASGPIGLVVTGGSQMQTAVDVEYLEELLAKRDINPNPVYSLARSNYSIITEHLLIRELIAERKVRTALIMIEPASSEVELPERVPKLAEISDVTEVWSLMLGQDFSKKLDTIRQIFVNYFKPTNGGVPPNIFGVAKHHCFRPDSRLDLPIMADAENKWKSLVDTSLDWDFTDQLQKNLLNSVRAMKLVADQHDVELIYILMSGSQDALPDNRLEREFYEATGAAIITLDRKIHDWLSENGRRDTVHINQAGREIFLPWLIERIQKVCRRKEGCF